MSSIRTLDITIACLNTEKQY